MKAKYGIGDRFTLKKNHAFTRSFPLGGYNADGSVREIDKEHKNAGNVGIICEVHDSPDVPHGQVWYLLDFGNPDELKLSLNEKQLLDLFDH